MRLTKHHGLGNDFLVMLDADGERPIPPAEARRLCERRTGIGADGVIRATPGGAIGVAGASDHAVATMELLNADGSRAEMSGNGIRCLAQALVLAGWALGERIAIVTDAGLRTVRRGDDIDAVTQTFAVDMGSVRIGADAPEWVVPGVARAVTVDVGNPHLVLELVDGSDAPRPDLVELGELANAKIAGGANLHLLRGDGADAVSIRTYERGVGPTLACGTGACASAAAAHHWGLTGRNVRVTMPGGDVEVTLPGSGRAGAGSERGSEAGSDAESDAGAPGGAAVLRGPATFVAAIDTDPPGHAGDPSGRGEAAAVDARGRTGEAQCR